MAFGFRSLFGSPASGKRRITLIQGHPDPEPTHLCHALADAYRRGAEAGRHEVRPIEVARLTFPLIRNKHDFEDGPRQPDIQRAQADIRWARHLVWIYPLWQGTMPALLKGFIEQAFRYDFAFEPTENGGYRQLLKGRSARIVITMGMPALIYRYYFGAHSLRSLERNILRFAGIKPIRETLFGNVENAAADRRKKWLEQVETYGRRAV